MTSQKRNAIKEEIKFGIINHIHGNAETYNKLTAAQGAAKLEKEFSVVISPHTYTQWAKKFKFTYKSRRPGKTAKAEACVKNTSRIRMLALIIKNLCKECDLNCPNTILRMLDDLNEELDI